MQKRNCGLRGHYIIPNGYSAADVIWVIGIKVIVSAVPERLLCRGRQKFEVFTNKVVKPHNGPSAVLVLNGLVLVITLYRMQLFSLFLS